jgi:hypothetical protein
MFTRTHQVRQYVYTEVLESYRDLGSGRPKHRYVVRWRGLHSLAEELEKVRAQVKEKQNEILYWQAVIRRTVPPRKSFHPKRARDILNRREQNLSKDVIQLAALIKASDGLKFRPGESK